MFWRAVSKEKKKKLLQRENYAKIQEVKNVTFIMHRSIMRDQVLVIKTNGRMVRNLKGRGCTGCGLEWDRAIWRCGQSYRRYIHLDSFGGKKEKKKGAQVSFILPAFHQLKLSSKQSSKAQISLCFPGKENVKTLRFYKTQPISNCSFTFFFLS